MATTIEKQKNKGLIECSLNDLLFPVEMIEQTDFACNSDYQFDIFGYLGDDKVKTRLNSCSDRYELVPNGSIFPPVRQILQSKNIKFSETYMHLHNARFYAEYKIMEHPYRVGGNSNDVIYPMLKVQHSYNGLTKYMITFGYFRLVCSNGLTIPVKEKEEFNLSIVGKHTSSIQNSLKRLMEVIDLFMEQGDKFLVNFDHMADRMVTKWEDRVAEVMGFAKISIVDNNKFKTLDYIGGVINKESAELYEGKVNDWLVYNAINQYINDNELNIKAPEVRAEMDKKVLEYLLQD